MNPGGLPTPDKPDISVVNYEPATTVSSFMIEVGQATGVLRWELAKKRPGDLPG
jgi:hypothetical protein